ncbi:MAG TPA: MarC family protein [Solirubrobacteraceae bacterium]|nr:MarC family protein [Solirubrobacteraceae bacterium]
MDVNSIDVQLVADLFLLLLIGIGPKIALVPFLELTDGLDAATRARVIRKMLTTATAAAVVLLVLGEVLRKLLHFSTGALAIAGGIILLVISASTVLRSDKPKLEDESAAVRDPMRLAVYPLAVPYLLNPTGIVVLVIISAEGKSVAIFGLALGLLAAVLTLDVVVFRLANKVSDHLDANRMLVTEKVFGFLLAALAVQLMLNGLDDLGLIHLAGH